MENIQLFSDSRMMEYAETAEKFRLPRWEQIPTLGLYMDQVVTVMHFRESYCSSCRQRPPTCEAVSCG